MATVDQLGRLILWDAENANLVDELQLDNLVLPHLDWRPADDFLILAAIDHKSSAHRRSNLSGLKPIVAGAWTGYGHCRRELIVMGTPALNDHQDQLDTLDDHILSPDAPAVLEKMSK